LVVDDFNFLPIESIEIGEQASKKALEKEKIKCIEQSLVQEQIATQSYLEYLQKPISQKPDETPEFKAYYYLYKDRLKRQQCESSEV
jgi:hypothetical protein